MKARGQESPACAGNRYTAASLGPAVQTGERLEMELEGRWGLHSERLQPGRLWVHLVLGVGGRVGVTSGASKNFCAGQVNQRDQNPCGFSWKFVVLASQGGWRPPGVWASWWPQRWSCTLQRIFPWKKVKKWTWGRTAAFEPWFCHVLVEEPLDRSLYFSVLQVPYL